MVGAAEALEIGLVDQLVPAAEVYDTARAWAAQFANGPALALAAAKKAIDGGLDTDLRTGLDLEAELFAALFATDGPQRSAWSRSWPTGRARPSSPAAEPTAGRGPASVGEQLVDRAARTRAAAGW